MGTTVIIVGGDDRGVGTAGSVMFTVGNGFSGNDCLNSQSPSSTPGSPAGGSYPTANAGETDGNGNGNGDGGEHNNVSGGGGNT